MHKPYAKDSTIESKLIEAHDAGKAKLPTSEEQAKLPPVVKNAILYIYEYPTQQSYTVAELPAELAAWTAQVHTHCPAAAKKYASEVSAVLKETHPTVEANTRLAPVKHLLKAVFNRSGNDLFQRALTEAQHNTVSEAIMIELEKKGLSTKLFDNIQKSEESNQYRHKLAEAIRANNREIHEQVNEGPLIEVKKGAQSSL